MKQEQRVITARHHIEMGRRIVERQRQIIRLRKIRGETTTDFEATHQVFERTLGCFEDDLHALLGKRP